MGNIVEQVSVQKVITCPCVKLDERFYLDTRTGEVLEYKHFESRADGLQGVRRTLSRVRALVNTNITEPDKVRWITLTYAENMTDTIRLYSDYEKFWKRFSYWCKKSNISVPKYINVVEPQGRGAWHIHAFFIWDEPAPFIPNKTLADLWKQGFVKIKAVTNCDNIGAYFSAYLADIPVDDLEGMSYGEVKKVLKNGLLEEKSFTDENGLTKEKKFIKGGRLHFYPPKMNIIRYSRGIKQPDIEYMTQKEAKEKASSAKLTFSRCYEIVDDDGKVVNRISKSYYNYVRK